MEFFKITIPLLLIIHFTSTTEGYDSTKFYQSDRKQVYYIENEYTVSYKNFWKNYHFWNTFSIYSSIQHDWFQSMAACARMNMTMLAIESRAKSEEVNRLILKTFGKALRKTIYSEYN